MQRGSQQVTPDPLQNQDTWGIIFITTLFSLSTETTYSEGNVCSFLTEEDLFQPATALCLLS